MPDKLRYILYARKSTDVEDKQIRSIEAQIAELRDIARRDGLTVVAEIVEKQSAKKPGRPLFGDMISRFEAGEADGILAWHADRLARNSLDGGRIIYLLDVGMIKRLRFYGSSVENTPQGKMMLNVEFGFSKYYVDALSENVKRGHRNKVARGECPCNASLGYLNDHRTKRIVVDRDRAPVVKAAFELYAQGNATLDTIRQYLGAHGIRSSPTARSPGGKLIGRSAVSNMLSNPVYYGHFRWGGDVYPGTHEPIIPKALFDQVQAVMGGRWRWSPSNHVIASRPFLRLLRCAECGYTVSAELQKGHTYYRCTKKSETIRCAQPYVREETLDLEISQLLAPFQPPAGWAKKMLARIEIDRDDTMRASAARVAEIRAQIERLNCRLTRLKELLLDGVIDGEEGRTERSKLLSQRKTLEEQATSLSHGDTYWLEPFKEWVNTAELVGEIACKGHLTEKAKLAKKVFGSNLVLDRKKARGVAVKPWAFLADNELSHDSAHLFDLARTYFLEIGSSMGCPEMSPTDGPHDS